MMTRIVSLATLVPMLLHSILGCCWHHDHASVFDGLFGRMAAIADDSVDDAACDDGHRFGCHAHSAKMPDHGSGLACVLCSTDCSSPGHQDETPCEPCREEHCVYVGSGKVEPPKLLVISRLDVSSDVTDGLILLSPLSIHGSNPRSDHSSPTSLSLRAQTQVWLI